MKKSTQVIIFIMTAILIITNILSSNKIINAAAISSNIYKDKNCEITFKVNSEWDTGFKGPIIFANTAKELIKDCKITFDFPYEINTIRDGEIKTHKGNNYTIQHKQYNNDKPIVQSIQDNTDNLDNDDYIDFSIRYNITSQLENEYNMEVTIQNNGENIIKNWRLSFNFEDEIQTIWNAKIESSDENYYIIKNDGWNQDIKPNKKVTFGITAKFKNFIHEPENAEMNTACLQVQEKDYIINCSSTDGKTAKVQIKNLSNEEIEDWKLFIPNSFKITDIWDAEISFQDNQFFYINNAQYNSNIKSNSTIEFGFNFSGVLPDNKKMQLYQMKLYNIQDFIEDKDDDGISDDPEVNIYGTSPDKADTDGDGLSDYYELFVSITDPLKTETQKGIKDSKLDLDEDGLTLIEEIELETDPILTDTDYDGLSDGEEVKIYKTNPLQYDTDYDGLSDYDEIILDLDPLKKDTGNIGVIDSKKEVKQTIIEEIERGKGINKVEVILKAKGNVAQDTFIDEVYDISDMSSDKALLGAPIKIEIDSNIKDSAIVKLYLDSSILKKVANSNNLTLALYDEDKQICKILKSKFNKKDAAISTETKIFGEFCLIDKSKLQKKVLQKGSLSVSKTTLINKLDNLIKKEQGWKSIEMLNGI